MAKTMIAVGFSIPGEGRPGVVKGELVEKQYLCELARVSRQIRAGETITDDLTVSNTFNIVADPFANDHIFAMQYLVWQGGYWKIDNVVVQPPRLQLFVGGVYSGRRAAQP